MSLSAVFKYMAKQAVDCRNMVRVKVWHTHTEVWLLKNYSQRILTYYTRIFITGPNVWSHYGGKRGVQTTLPALMIEIEKLCRAQCALRPQVKLKDEHKNQQVAKFNLHLATLFQVLGASVPNP